MTKKPVVQPQDKYVLRMPDGLRDRIKAAAEANKKSMNAEMVEALEKAYPDPKRFSSEFWLVKEIDSVIGKLAFIRMTEMANLISGAKSEDHLKEITDKLGVKMPPPETDRD